MHVQDTYYLDLSGNYTPHWLGVDIAEQLRADANARLTLDAEYAQVRAPLPPSLAEPGAAAPAPKSWGTTFYAFEMCAYITHPITLTDSILQAEKFNP